MGDPESQKIPFAPAGEKIHHQPPYTTFRKPKSEKSNKCLVYVLAVVVLLGIVLLVLCTVFWRVNNPKLRLNSVTIQNLRYENSNSTSSLNMTLLAKVTLHNDNFGRYDFDSCFAVVLQGISAVGGGDIPGGSVGARKTEVMNVTMRVSSSDLNFTSGGGGGTTEVVEIGSYAKMTGKVHVIKMVDRRKTIEMNCTMNVNLTSQSVTGLLCT